MKNLISITVLILMLFALTTVSAQKIKVKKDFVEADKVQIAKVEKLGSSFVYTSLNDENEKVVVDHNKLKISDAVSKEWIVVKNADDTKSTEIDLEYISFTMSLKKAIAEFLMKKYSIITTDGIDLAALNSFLDTDRPNLTKEYGDLLKGATAETRELNAALSDVNVSIKEGTNEIYEGDVNSGSSIISDKAKLLGSYSDKRVAAITTFTIYDLDNHKVAIATAGNAFGKVDVNLPYEKTEFTYKMNGRNKNSNGSYNSQFIEDLVAQIAVKGVALGHQINDKKRTASAAQGEQKKSEYLKAKEDSNNIYGAPGYVLSEKGDRIEGDVSVKWTDIPAPGDWDNVVSIGGEDTGKKVSVRYLNKKGKTRYKTFSSKDEERFCVTQDGEEQCYLGAKIKGKGLELAAGAVSSLSFDTSEYYKIVKEDDKLYILQDVDNGAYSIKIKKKKKGFQFNTSNSEKNLEGMNKYFGGDLSSLQDLDFKELSSAKMVADFYKQR